MHIRISYSLNHPVKAPFRATSPEEKERETKKREREHLCSPFIHKPKHIGKIHRAVLAVKTGELPALGSGLSFRDSSVYSVDAPASAALVIAFPAQDVPFPSSPRKTLLVSVLTQDVPRDVGWAELMLFSCEHNKTEEKEGKMLRGGEEKGKESRRRGREREERTLRPTESMTKKEQTPFPIDKSSKTTLRN